MLAYMSFLFIHFILGFFLTHFKVLLCVQYVNLSFIELEFTQVGWMYLLYVSTCVVCPT